jgi:phage host-nuclease inhibitor protein Gam
MATPIRDSLDHLAATISRNKAAQVALVDVQRELDKLLAENAELWRYAAQIRNLKEEVACLKDDMAAVMKVVHDMLNKGQLNGPHS